MKSLCSKRILQSGFMLFSQDFYNIKSSRTHHSNLYISSAEMDGATGLKKTWYITLPLIADVLVTCTTLAITGAIKVFNLPTVTSLLTRILLSSPSACAGVSSLVISMT